VGVSTVTDRQPLSLQGGKVVVCGTIRVFDIMGRLVATGRDCLDTATLPHGIYLIQTSAGTIRVAN